MANEKKNEKKIKKIKIEEPEAENSAEEVLDTEEDFFGGIADAAKAFAEKITCKKEKEMAEEPTPATEPEAETTAETKKDDKKPAAGPEKGSDDFLLDLEQRIVDLEKGLQTLSEAAAELKDGFAKAKATVAKVVNETTDVAMARAFAEFEKRFRGTWEPRFCEVLNAVQTARSDAAKAESAMAEVLMYLPQLRQMTAVKEDLQKMQTLRDEIVSAKGAIMAALGRPQEQKTGLFG